jgi:hypothetical protein
MNRQIWFGRDGQPLDTETANRLLGDMDYKRVGLTRVTSSSDPDAEFTVSTVWLGIDHSFGDGPPLLFETMVFGGGESQDQTQWRWGTEAEARAGHAEIVASVAASVPGEHVEELNAWPADAASEPVAKVGFHLHRWGKWEDGMATYDSPLFPKLGEWKGPVQVRRCTKCGKTSLRRME